MYFGATPFSAAAFSDVGFNPNAFVSLQGVKLNVNIGTSDVTIVAKAREILTGNGLELGIGDAQASIPKDVPVTGNGFEIAKGTVTTKAGAKPDITGQGLDLGIGNVTIIGKCNLSVTGNGFEVALGNATTKANATAIVTGKRFNISTNNVTVIAKSKVLPSGNRFNIGTSDILIRKWEAVQTNATQVWTEI